MVPSDLGTLSQHVREKLGKFLDSEERMTLLSTLCKELLLRVLRSEVWW